MQVGLLALSMPGVGLDVLGAESEGQIGYACPVASASLVQHACVRMDLGKVEFGKRKPAHPAQATSFLCPRLPLTLMLCDTCKRS